MGAIPTWQVRFLDVMDRLKLGRERTYLYVQGQPRIVIDAVVNLRATIGHVLCSYRLNSS